MTQSDNTHQPLDEAELRKAIQLRIEENYSPDDEFLAINRAVEQLYQLFQSQLAAAEKRGVAWSVGIIDEFHMMPHEESYEWFT